MNDRPFVSVMIPMRNEATSISRCLDSVLAQDYPADRFEVLVVDGTSTDGSDVLIARYAERDPRVHLLRNPHRIVPSALNIAIRAARGDVIMRVDGHTRIAPDYMRTGVDALRRTGADNVGGPMRAVGGGVIGDAIALATSSRFGIGSYFHYGREEAEADTVYMGMFSRHAFERVGLFDEEMVRNQDDEFNYRLRKAGGRIVLTPAMRSSYQNRQSLTALAKQYAQYGFWKVRVLQKHPAQMSARHFVPPALVHGLLLPLCAAPWLPALLLVTLAQVVIYLLAVSVVSARIARRERGDLFVPLVATFATLHLSWGSGFAAGMVRFASRWLTPEPAAPQLTAPAQSDDDDPQHTSERLASPRRASSGG
ncbi:MAG TPA: glycosyltransferase family 2 protein [Candidatus Binatia bacterium]|nr:glycosyltransferase family 2 protein [Candidatus Binatia bacterium]